MNSDDIRTKRARRAAHPDANGGDRTGWNAVEAAAITLGLKEAR